MQFADAVMAGRLGAESLAAVAVGGSVWFLGFTLALGTLMAICTDCGAPPSVLATKS